MKLLKRLDHATRQWHADADAPWLELLHPLVTRGDYLGVLLRTFGFVAPLESACRYTPGLERMLDTRRLTRAGLLAQDLLTLGLSPARVARAHQCLGITTFRDVPEALGWLYVLQRSATMQTGIRDHVLSRHPVLVSASAYLAELDGRAHEQEAELGRVLDQVGTTPELEDDIVAGACAGFECAKAWAQDEQTQSEQRRRVG